MLFSKGFNLINFLFIIFKIKLNISKKYNFCWLHLYPYLNRLNSDFQSFYGKKKEEINLLEEKIEEKGKKLFIDKIKNKIDINIINNKNKFLIIIIWR